MAYIILPLFITSSARETIRLFSILSVLLMTNFKKSTFRRAVRRKAYLEEPHEEIGFSSYRATIY